MITFVFLGYLGTQPPTAGLSELGFRFSELYFAFFVILWLYSRERSRSVHLRTLIVFVVLFALADVVRFDPSKAVLMVVSALIPLAYLVAFVLGPVYTRLNESQPLPERVVYP